MEGNVWRSEKIQPFSQKSRTPTVAKEFQIGLCGVVEADLELFYNCWSAGFLGERLYVAFFLCTARSRPSLTWSEPKTADVKAHELCFHMR